MLDADFLDWWFSPWRYAVRSPAGLAPALEPLARRDGYRLWCRQANLPADLPASLEPAWQLVATDDGAALRASARLFAGLLAARGQRRDALAALAFAERKWCMAVAATQPLQGCRAPPYTADDALEVVGLVELARRLETQFAGLWPRLRLTLPEPLAERVDALLARVAGESVEASARRAQRCWSLCRQRAAVTWAPNAGPVADTELMKRG
ncbi:hypothetical protein ACFOLJ_03150 [Rugamonas sp. CCM 8940]|uniref:hypothetical protein n=1 Tax=Rugamonas sp. CCM 8940 TaxID=2765359 RepID=UPI0018F2FD71|nr:hypothetical protein [Rugamonas sp. CCM 8940]MBJ7311937.1 hypothetical protein [Rugamonas sp. CCM 8940]